MGVGRIFSGGPLGDFPILLGRAQSGEIRFFPLETKEITFLLKF